MENWGLVLEFSINYISSEVSRNYKIWYNRIKTCSQYVIVYNTRIVYNLHLFYELYIRNCNQCWKNKKVCYWYANMNSSKHESRCQTSINCFMHTLQRFFDFKNTLAWKIKLYILMLNLVNSTLRKNKNMWALSSASKNFTYRMYFFENILLFLDLLFPDAIVPLILILSTDFSMNNIFDSNSV